LAVASAIPLVIAGAIFASMRVAVVGIPPVTVSLFLDAPEGSVFGANGPHRYRPASTEKPSSATTQLVVATNAKATRTTFDSITDQDAFDNLDDLADRLQGIPRRRPLCLFVSALAKLEHERVLLLCNADGSSNHSKVYLDDVFRILESSPARERLVILDVQWPCMQNNNPKCTIDPATTFANLEQLVQRYASASTQIILSTGPESWARGSSQRTDSLFGHAWKLSLANQQTDRNGDRRLTIDEILRNVTEQMRCWSEDDSLPVQKPRTYGGPVGFAFPLSSPAVDAGNVVATDPDWLISAQVQRSNYLANANLPINFAFVDRWQDHLLGNQSSWQRGIDDAKAGENAKTLARWAQCKIDSQLAELSGLRPDSLWLKASTQGNRRQLPALEQKLLAFLDSLNSIPISKNLDQDLSAIEASSRDFLGKLDRPDHLTVLNALIQKICQVENPPHSWKLAAVSLGALIDKQATFAEIQILRKIVNRNPEERDWSDDVLRIVRARCELATHPATFAILEPQQSETLKLCITAERFAWSERFTTQAFVSQIIAESASKIEAGLARQRGIIQSVRVLEQAVILLKDRHLLNIDDEALQPTLESAEDLAQLLFDPEDVSPGRGRSTRRLQFENIRHAAENLRALQQAIEQQIPLRTRKQRFPLCLADSRSTELSEPFASRIESLEQLLVRIDQIGREKMLATSNQIYHDLASIDQLDEIYKPLISAYGGAPPEPLTQAATIRWPNGRPAWDSSSVQCQVILNDPKMTDKSIAYRICPLASPAVILNAMHGVLTSAGAMDITLSLDTNGSSESPVSIAGFWVQLIEGNQTTYVPVRWPDFPLAPEIEIVVDSSVLQDQPESCMRLWPNSTPQQRNWHLANRTSLPRSVTVAMGGSNVDSVYTTILDLPPNKLVPIRFPNPPPNPAASTKIGEGIPAGTPFWMQAIDTKTNEVLHQKTIAFDLYDPRQCIDVRTATFDTFARGSQNRFQATFGRTQTSNPEGHEIRIIYEGAGGSPIVDVGSGHPSTRLTADSQIAHITLRNIVIPEAENGHFLIPLMIDGDQEAIWLAGSATNPMGQSTWNIDRRPRVIFDIPKAALPGRDLDFSVAGVNLDRHCDLCVEIGQLEQGVFVERQRRILPTSRRPSISITQSANDATFELTARWTRWNVQFPIDISGDEAIVRIRSLDGDFETVQRRIVLDAEPVDVMSALATEDAPTEIQIQVDAGRSGVHSVAAVSGDTILGYARRLDTGDGLWELTTEKPVARLDLRVVSGAGKSSNANVPVRLITPKQVGQIGGVVFEGTIPQPHLEIDVTTSDGHLQTIRTDRHGRFDVAVPPGPTLITVRKPASGRQAQKNIDVQANDRASLQLHLMRIPPGGA
jgi:hypothetical protein